MNQTNPDTIPALLAAVEEAAQGFRNAERVARPPVRDLDPLRRNRFCSEPRAAADPQTRVKVFYDQYYKDLYARAWKCWRPGMTELPNLDPDTYRGLLNLGRWCKENLHIENSVGAPKPKTMPAPPVAADLQGAPSRADNTDLRHFVKLLREHRAALDTKDRKRQHETQQAVRDYAGSVEQAGNLLRNVQMRCGLADIGNVEKAIDYARNIQAGHLPDAAWFWDNLGSNKVIEELERGIAAIESMKESNTPATSAESGPATGGNGKRTPAPPHEPANTIERSGDLWTFTFQGRTLPPIRGTSGPRWLARLLVQPGPWILATALMEKPEAEAERRQMGTTAKEEPPEETDAPPRKGMKRNESNAQSDRDSIVDYYRKLRGLRADQQGAQTKNDQAAVNKCRREIDFITEELKKLTGPGGRLKEFADATGRAYEAAEKARDRIYKAIATQSPEFHQHLRNCIHFDKPCVSYTPETDPAWEWRQSTGQ